jgi:hypothetical protein
MEEACVVHRFKQLRGVGLGGGRVEYYGRLAEFADPFVPFACRVVAAHVVDSEAEAGELEEFVVRALPHEREHLLPPQRAGRVVDFDTYVVEQKLPRRNVTGRRASRENHHRENHSRSCRNTHLSPYGSFYFKCSAQLSYQCCPMSVIVISVCPPPCMQRRWRSS